MAVRKLSETPGYTENEVLAPASTENTELNPEEGTERLPRSSSGFSPPEQENVVPGQSELPDAPPTPSADDGSLAETIQNVGASLGGETEKPTEGTGDTETPAVQPPESPTEGYQPADFAKTTLGSISLRSNAPAQVPENISRTIKATPREGGDPLSIAQAYLGADERDPKSAAALSAFIKNSAGLSIDPSNTAWCAGFANAVLGKAGFGGTGKLNAQSFLNYGLPVDKPQVGDVVVFQRGAPGSWQGHVGFIAGVNKDGTIDVLGGNQSTAESGARGVTVNIKTFTTDSVLGYRRPIAPTAKTDGQDTVLARIAGGTLGQT